MVTLIGAISFVKQNPAQNKIEAAEDYYDLGRVTLNRTESDGPKPVFNTDLVKNYSKFRISNYHGLKVLSYVVNWGMYFFPGKTVYLANDIDCKEEGYIVSGNTLYGNTISIGQWKGDETNKFFQGNFDGCGFTISNFKLNPQSYYGGTADAYGLFSKIDSNSTIQNLKLENYSLTVTSASSDYGQAAGGIVGYLAGGKIVNCMVEGFSVSTTYSAINTMFQSNQMCVGGIFGVGYGTVEYCHVKTISTSKTKTMVGIGPADFPYLIEMRGGNNVWFSYKSYYSKSNSTISSCVVQEFETTYDYAIPEYVSDVGSSGGKTITKYSHKITNCQSAAGGPVVSSSSSAGGVNHGTYWYYGEGYNDQYPYLRQFIKEWLLIELSVNPEDGGTITGDTIENSSIQIPGYGTDLSIDWTQQTLNILDQILTATANEGWRFTGWEIGSSRLPTEEEKQLYISLVQPVTAKFERNLCNLQFNDTTGDYIKSPDSSPTNFTVFYNTVVEPTFIDNVLKYKFTSNNEQYEVIYEIPEKYAVAKESLYIVTVTEPTEITPILITKKYGVNFDGEGGSWGEWEDFVLASSSGPEQIEHGTTIKYIVTKYEITIIMNEQTKKVFKTNEGYEIDYLKIITKTGAIIVNPGKNGQMVITEEVEFYAYARKLYYITFDEAIDENSSMGVATLNTEYISANRLKIKQGDNLTGDYNFERRKLTYTYNGEDVATYEGIQFYAVVDEDDKDEIIDVNDNSDLTIQPIFSFYACMVTMGEIDSKLGSREIEYSYGNIQGNSLAVEFGTQVNFSFKQENGIFTYIYAFKHNGTEVAKVTYEMKESRYVMQYELNSTTGERISMVNGLNGNLEGDSHTFNAPENVEDLSAEYTQKEINPTFGLKQYWGNLA